MREAGGDGGGSESHTRIVLSAPSYRTELPQTKQPAEGSQCP